MSPRARGAAQSVTNVRLGRLIAAIAVSMLAATALVVGPLGPTASAAGGYCTRWVTSEYDAYRDQVILYPRVRCYGSGLQALTIYSYPGNKARWIKSPVSGRTYAGYGYAFAKSSRSANYCMIIDSALVWNWGSDVYQVQTEHCVWR